MAAIRLILLLLSMPPVLTQAMNFHYVSSGGYENNCRIACNDGYFMSRGSCFPNVYVVQFQVAITVPSASAFNVRMYIASVASLAGIGGCADPTMTSSLVYETACTAPNAVIKATVDTGLVISRRLLAALGTANVATEIRIESNPGMADTVRQSVTVSAVNAQLSANSVGTATTVSAPTLEVVAIVVTPSVGVTTAARPTAAAGVTTAARPTTAVGVTTAARPTTAVGVTTAVRPTAMTTTLAGPPTTTNQIARPATTKGGDAVATTAAAPPVIATTTAAPPPPITPIPGTSSANVGLIVGVVGGVLGVLLVGAVTTLVVVSRQQPKKTPASPARAPPAVPATQPAVTAKSRFHIHHTPRIPSNATLVYAVPRQLYPAYPLQHIQIHSVGH